MKRILIKIIFLSLLPLPVFAAQQPAQDKDEAITLRGLLIDLRAVVTDKNGRIVENLKKDDFELLENDAPQQISFFSEERISSGPNNISNESPSPSSIIRRRETPARAIVFFLDAFRLSPADIERAKKSLARFVNEQMSDNDLVAIVTTDGRLGLLSQLTQDRKTLRSAIEKIGADPTGAQKTPLAPYLAAMVARKQADAAAVATKILQSEESLMRTQDESSQAGRLINRVTGLTVEQRADEALVEESSGRRAVLSNIKFLAARLAELPGQRIIALLSNGFSLFGQLGATETDELRTAISRASRAGVMVYAISPGGLEGSPLGRADYPMRFNLDSEFQRFDKLSKADLKDGLQALASETGGKFIENENDLNKSFQKLLDDNQVYYRIAYYPANGTTKDARRILARVKNHPDYVARTQRGYSASDIEKPRRETDPAKRLFAALAEPLSYRGLDVSATADFLERAADDAQATLHIDLDASDLQYQTRGDHQLLDLELAIAVYNMKGELVETAFDKVHIDSPSDAVELTRKNGYRYTKRIKMKPGVYQARVGLREIAKDRLGTATAWLEIPDLKNGKLAASSIVLSQRDPKTERVTQPKANNGIRFYRAVDPLLYYVRAYNVDERAASELLLQSELFQGEKLIAQSGWEPAASLKLGSDRKGLELGGNISFSEMATGLYELRVKIKRAKSNEQAEQSITFGITR